MEDCGFGCGVGVCACGTEGADCEPGDGACDYDPAWILRRRILTQQRCKLLNCEKHAFDVQVHDAVPAVLLVCFGKGGAPCCACVCEKYIDVVGVFGDFGDEVVDAGEFGGVGWNRDRGGRCGFGGQGVEGRDGGGAGVGFAGGDEDFGTACLEETDMMVLEARGGYGRWRGRFTRMQHGVRDLAIRRLRLRLCL
jgi:hypothetical protein